MKNNWMRIALGAPAIFVVGMVVISRVRRSIGGMLIQMADSIPSR